MAKPYKLKRKKTVEQLEAEYKAAYVAYKTASATLDAAKSPIDLNIFWDQINAMRYLKYVGEELDEALGVSTVDRN